MQYIILACSYLLFYVYFTACSAWPQDVIRSLDVLAAKFFYFNQEGGGVWQQLNRIKLDKFARTLVFLKLQCNNPALETLAIKVGASSEMIPRFTPECKEYLDIINANMGTYYNCCMVTRIVISDLSSELNVWSTFTIASYAHINASMIFRFDSRSRGEHTVYFNAITNYPSMMRNKWYLKNSELMYLSHSGGYINPCQNRTHGNIISFFVCFQIKPKHKQTMGKHKT